MKEQIKKLLGRGLPQTVVANAVGCTEGYISQLLQDDDFAAEVAALKLAAVEKESSRSAVVNEIKDALLLKVQKALPMMVRPAEILGALKVIDGLRCGDSSSALSIAGGAGMQQVVQVNLPAITMQNFVKNSQGEIVEVGGRSLATLNSAALKNILKETQNDKLSNETAVPTAASHEVKAATAG